MDRESGISYRGEVSLCIRHGKRKVRDLGVHNEGTVTLMRFLCRCLGSSYDESNAPKYIRLFNAKDGATKDASALSADNECTIQPVASNFQPTFGQTDEDGEGGMSASVTLTFLVPFTLLGSSKSTFNMMGVYSTQTKDKSEETSPLAWVKITDDDNKDSNVTLVNGESLMVSWKMTLSNK